MIRRTVLPLALLLLLVGIVNTRADAQTQPQSDTSQGAHHAALVLRYPDGSVQTACVAFSEASITGEELLQRSGLTVVMNYNAGLGGAVCSINGAGCAFPTQDCFCQCQGLQCEYWAYYHWTGSGWQYSQVGASQYSVQDGALEGWSWGPGNFTIGTIPPSASFDQICAVPTSTPTATVTAAATSTASATATNANIPPSAPDVTFEVTSPLIGAGTCTVLKWLAWNADQVTLNGQSVLAQDRKEVCPDTTQRYVLQATNRAGQTRRDLTVSVAGPSASSTPSSPAPAAPTLLPQLPTPTLPALDGTAALAVPSPDREATTSVVLPAPFRTDTGAASIAEAQPAVPEEATPAPGLASTADTDRLLAMIFEPTPTETPALAGDRAAVVDGRPSPTPILVARAPSPDESNSVASYPAASGNEAGNRAPTFTPPDRSFHLALLPGYAAFAILAAILLAAGLVVALRQEM